MSGRRFPARYCTRAPPAVLMWSIWSCIPYLRRAVERCPPLMIVVPKEDAMALRSPSVPRLNSSHSKAPGGPLMNTVPAPLISLA